MKSVRLACISVLLLSVVPASGQSKLSGLLGKKAPAPQAEDSVLDKSSEDFYLDMKDFAEGLYNKQVGEGDKRQDSDFKRRVDGEYEAQKRHDADRAYSVNLSAHSEVKRIMEDRFRVFSGLYDNLLVQDLLNRTGQSVIPAGSGHLYTFKLIADPIPRAETLSTGTIYVTTGLVALLDTKAELAYVLAHEAAHVYHNDFRTEIMLNLAAEEYAKEKGANQEAVNRKLQLLLGLGGAGLGAMTGGALGHTGYGAAVGLVGGMATAAVVSRMGGGPDERAAKDWNRIQEDEADRTAFEWVLKANLDVQEIPRVYQALKDAGDRDERVTLGFLGRSNRVRERATKIAGLIALEQHKADFAQRVFEASDPDFDILMAEVKRDNGVLAFEYDMLDMAKDNLSKAAAIKKNDPTTLYFYARILMETARTPEQRDEANRFFRLAAENDSRNLNYGSQLHRAVALLKPDATTAEKQEAVGLLKTYLEDYYLSSVQDSERASYPPHLETIYDFLSRLGEFAYVLDGKKVLAQREAAQKMQESAGGSTVDVTPVDNTNTPKKTARRVVKTP